MARELKPNPYYTREKLIAECQEAINLYGYSIKLVYVFLDSEHFIGHKYKAQKKPSAWTRLETGGALAYVDCDCEDDELQTVYNKVQELLRWLFFSNPNTTENLAVCSSWLAAMSSKATQPPLQTREGKEAFVCGVDGKPFVYFDSTEPQDELIINLITKTTGDDNALKHFKKYPDCQWTMVWDDALGAIQMAVKAQCSPGGIAGLGNSGKNQDDLVEIELANPVEKIGGWTKKEIVDHVKDKTGSWSSSSFVNVRKKSTVVASESSGKGQQRRYADDEIEELALTVENQKNSFRDGAKIASALRQLLSIE